MRLFFFLALFFSLHLNGSLNEIDGILEPILSDHCLIEEKQIKIPGFPTAYNPSLIPYREGYLLSFRYTTKYPETIKNGFRKGVSLIGLVRLDKNFKVLEKTIQLLDLISYSPYFSLTAEDGRLFCIEDRIFIFFNDQPVSRLPGQFAMYVGEIIEEQGIFHLKLPAKPLNYAQIVPIEKNWTPFAYEGHVYLIYSDQPRIILELDLDTGDCEEISHTFFDPDWKWGRIRGGTPALLVDDTFLTFFHSSFSAQTKKGKIYVMGAYTFEKEAPFSMRTITLQPLGALSDYSEDNPSKIVFPGGMVVENLFVHVAWGKGDKQIWITTFDKKALLSSMQ